MQQRPHLAAGVGHRLLNAVAHRFGGAGLEFRSLGGEAVIEGAEGQGVRAVCVVVHPIRICADALMRNRKNARAQKYFADPDGLRRKPLSRSRSAGRSTTRPGLTARARK
jgi:hypothetical protein